MSESDDLRRRVETLEARVDNVHDQMSQTRAMVAISDRDVADLKLEMRAHRKVLEALRETQLDQSRRIDAVDAKVDALDAKVEALDVKMANGFATVLVAVQAIADRLPDEPAA